MPASVIAVVSSVLSTWKKGELGIMSLDLVDSAPAVVEGGGGGSCGSGDFNFDFDSDFDFVFSSDAGSFTSLELFASASSLGCVGGSRGVISYLSALVISTSVRCALLESEVSATPSVLSRIALIFLSFSSSSLISLSLLKKS